MRCAPPSRPTPAVLLNVTHIVSEEQAVAAISKSDCTRGCKKAGVYLPQELDASHHVHPYNMVTRGLGFHFHPSMVLGDKDYRDTGSCSHCRCCITGCYWCILYLSLISPLGKYCADGCRAFPPHDESTMTLAPLLQHFEDTNVAMVLGPGSEMAEWAMRAYPSLSKSTSSSSPSGATTVSSTSSTHLTLAALRILFPRTRIVTTHHTKDACVGSWVRAHLPPFSLELLVLRRSILIVPLLPLPHLADARLPALLRSVSVFRCVSFIRLFISFFTPFLRSFLSPIRLAQTDSANMALPKAQVSGESLVLLVGRLSPDNNLGLLVHALAGLSP
ncbi:hypothetical protein B0H13DRAFT_2392892 [Mycena leptocephala]|nr:hypothetical protein B0H13DRAFT_2392892 [Mycena leptocephala]